MLLLQAFSIRILQPINLKCLETEAIKAIRLTGLGKMVGLVKGVHEDPPVPSLEAARTSEAW